MKFSISKLKPLANIIRIEWFKIIANNRFFLRVFFLFNSSFDREYEASTLGRIEALSSKYEGGVSNAHIRRCIHRLEKGMFHQKRKTTFGESIIEELWEELNRFKINNGLDSSELVWAKETLQSYIELVPNNKAKKCLSILETYPSINNEQIDRGNIENINYQMLSNLIDQRESIRFFENIKVEMCLIEQAVDLAKQGPSACNRQPYSIHVLQEPADINAIGSLAPGTQGFLEGVPVLLAIVGTESSFRHYKDRHLVYTDSGIFVGHLVLSLEALGLSSCVLNWVSDWANDRQAIKYLNLSLSNTIVCLMAIGYRKKDCVAPKSFKKNNQTMITYK